MTTLLVIEDNSDNMALIKEILDDEGFESIRTDRAEDGIEQLRANRDRVNLVLMDISLPVMNGLDAARIIRQDPLFVDLPVIALTAHAMKVDRDAALSAGCNDFLTKPIDEEILIETIHRYLKK